MRIMPDIVLLRPDAINAEPHKQQRKQPARDTDGYREQTDPKPGKQRHRSEHHPTNRTRCPYGTIATMMTMDKKGQQTPADQACKINKKEIQTSQPHFHHPAKDIKAE